MRRFLAPALGAIVLAFAFAGCDAGAPEASSLSFDTASGATATAETSLNGEVVDGPSAINSECVHRYFYSNTDGGFTFWDINNQTGTASIVGTGVGRRGRPYADVKGGLGGTVQVRAHNDTVAPYIVTKQVFIDGNVACL